MNPIFLFFLFSNTNTVDRKAIKIVVDETRFNEHVKTVEDVRKLSAYYEQNGWTPHPEPKRCGKCPLAKECDHFTDIPKIITVNYNMKTNNDIQSRKQKMYLFIQKEFNLYKRKYTEEPYFNHLVAVAKNCSFHNIKYGYEIGLCHDLFEDTAMLPHEFIEIIVGFGYAKNEAEIISNAVFRIN